jgi:hypothetical protein
MFSFFAASLPFSKDDSSQWVILCVGVLATLYVIMRPKMKRKKDPLDRPAPLSVSQQRQIERDISQLMVEMLETARQMTAQLDTRAARLELLIQEADGRLTALKSVAAPVIAPPPAPTEQPLTAAAPPAEPAPVPPPAAELPPPELPEESPPDPRHADIYSMADQGRSPHEIARLLNRPNGEVELILALRPHE